MIACFNCLEILACKNFSNNKKKINQNTCFFLCIFSSVFSGLFLVRLGLVRFKECLVGYAPHAGSRNEKKTREKNKHMM